MKTLIIKGKKYIAKKVVHKKGDDKIYLIPLDEEKYEKIVSDIVEAVKGSLDPEEAVRAGLSLLDWDEIEKIHRAIRRNAKIRGEKGCYEIRVGKHFIPLVA
jgi:hypothetical protein